MTATAALFLNSNQLQHATSSPAPSAQQASNNTTVYDHLYTTWDGLDSTHGAAFDSSLVGTGQVVGTGSAGSVCAVFAAAGTYDVSVRFSATFDAGNPARAKQRHLWVLAVRFDSSPRPDPVVPSDWVGQYRIQINRLLNTTTATGKAIIGTEEDLPASMGLLPTPDRVTGVVLPANALLLVWYHALWKANTL